MTYVLPAARWWGLLAVVGMVLVSGCSVLAGAEPAEPVVVGVDLDLTSRGGLDTVFGQALELRAEQLNQQRERSGGRPVELRVLDNGADRGASVANVAELAADARVSAVITGGCGECVIAAAEDINAAGVPVVSLAAAGAVAEPVAERRFIFKVAPDAAGSADVMAAELAGRGVDTVGLVTSDDRYGQDGAGEFGEAAAALGVDLAVREVAGAGGDADEFAGLATRITSWRREQDVDPFAPAEPAGLDAVVLWTPEPQAVALAVALRRAGWDGPLWLDAIAAGDLFQVGEVAAALAGARLLFSDTLAMDDVVASVPDLAKRRQWFDSYLSRYGTYHAPASFAADALDLVVAATDRIGTDPARVRDTLEAVRLPGLSGAVGFSPATHSGFDARSLAVLRFTDDRWHASAA